MSSLPGHSSAVVKAATAAPSPARFSLDRATPRQSAACRPAQDAALFRLENQDPLFGRLVDECHQLYEAADALPIMPHSVAFALRNDKSVTALPITIPHPERALRLLKRSDASRVPSVERFAGHIQSSFEDLRHLIKRHEQAVVWEA